MTTPARILPHELGGLLPREGPVWLHGCSGWSATIRDGLAGTDLAGVTLCGIFVPGVNRLDPLLDAGARVASFFMLPELARAHEQVEYLPLSYREIAHWLALNPPQAALFMVSPPDDQGMCSFGPVHDFLVDLWPHIPLRIAQINPSVPRTHGATIPFAALNATFEADEPLPESNPGTDSVAERIAMLAARLIPDGATLQTGLGRIPDAVLRALTGHRGLAIHSGLIGDGALHLLRSGAMRDRAPITAGVAIGSRQLYDALPDPAFRFAPPSVTHDLRRMAGLERFVSVNSAMMVDLDGQVFAEASARGPVSGPGGASEFAAGARAKGGVRIIALPSTAGGIGRIVAPGAGIGPVSLGRFDTDVVVTEHGAADLRGLGPSARRAALMAIADPAQREGLSA